MNNLSGVTPSITARTLDPLETNPRTSNKTTVNRKRGVNSAMTKTKKSKFTTLRSVKFPR